MGFYLRYGDARTSGVQIPCRLEDGIHPQYSLLVKETQTQTFFTYFIIRAQKER